MRGRKEEERGEGRERGGKEEGREGVERRGEGRERAGGGGGKQRGKGEEKEEGEERKEDENGITCKGQSLAHRVISNCTPDQQGCSTVLLPITRVGRDPEVSGSQHAPYLLYLKVHCR